MTEDSDGGGPSWTFGSRFSSLDVDQQELDSTQTLTKGNNRGNKGNKRTAVRATHQEYQFTKQQKVDTIAVHNGPRYLILKRTDEGKTMATVSPFFIRKAMDSITSNITIGRTKDGGLLLKTINRQQAVKLLKQTQLGTITIAIMEHPTMNTTRGTIFCPDLNMHKDEEITEELKHAHVINVKRIKRRNGAKLEDSGAFILTFNLGTLPNSIDVGFHLCRVRQYIPPPLRCMKCLKFGHKKDVCKGNQTCANCAKLYHDKTECQQERRCVVCRGGHHTLSKDCPVYTDELEIQRMKTTEKITYREARQKRRLQAPDPNPPRLRQLFSSHFNTSEGEPKKVNTTRDNNTGKTNENSQNVQQIQPCVTGKTMERETQMNTTMTTNQVEENSTTNTNSNEMKNPTANADNLHQSNESPMNNSQISSITNDITNPTNNSH
ncbi:uncharacterized protein LOC129761584 [Toxorhynchites rutilus septentrionalis]|uniref:uncharacterized protein LOC129761584 n=1 Tax=Toxorhynchites rutilus septentrionalis TaxID=329112 RepID=UPI0024787EC7|nr:uncharacterized protein LOC129761584 [Toxorhynchites rutilus septentrionalis]